MKPVSVLFTIPNFITAGSGGAMLNIIRRLDPARFAPAVAVLKKGGKLDAEVERLGIPLIEAPFVLPARPYATLLPRAWQAAKVFRPYHFDLWHSFHYGEDYTEPIIAYLSGARGWIYTKKNMSWGSRAWMLRTLLARHIAAQNQDMMLSFFNRGWLRNKTSFVPRGVDTQKFLPGLPYRLELRRQLGISAETPLLACVADLVAVKGHPILLQALASVPGAHLILAGRPLDESYAASLHVQARELGIESRVHFLGGVSDVPALLAESDLFVLPTLGRGRMEGCPVALLEAMACAKACVASNIPGSRDLIVDGECGLLVPPENSETLAVVIGLFLQDPQLRQELGHAARLRVEQRYTIEHETSAHEMIYNEIMN